MSRLRHYRQTLTAARRELLALHVDAQAARANSEQLLAEFAELTRRLAASEQTVGQLAERLAQFDERHQQSDERLRQADQRRDVEHDRLIHALRIIRDGDAGNWNRLWELRGEPDYELAFTEPDPLVSILIPTYTNWEGLRDRALPSVLAQTYRNWECVVVGDAAPPETAEVVESFGDPRLRFVNLPYRGPYPDRKEDAWLISGTNPFNTAMRLARGRWIGATADDDALLPGYTESLLALAREEHVEVAYGLLRFKYPDKPDELVGDGPPPRFAHWGVQCSLFHAGLKFVPLLYSDWLFSTSNDWSWGERLLRIGVRFAMLQEPVVDYFPSQLWKTQK
jgi:hypothetical protein